MRLHAAALSVVAASLLVGACQTDSDERGGMMGDSTAMGGMHRSMDRAAYSDARFLREMTAHHRMAVDMTAMAPAMATSAALKAMAATMSADQTREIAEMERLLAATGAPADTSAGGMAGMDHGSMDHGAMSGGAMTGMEMDMGMPMTMDELRAAQPFDRAFLVSMIGHHAAAVTMSAEAQARSGNPDVLRLARAIVTAQAAEIAQMQRMVDAMGAPSAATPSAGPPAAAAVAPVAADSAAR